jgi:ribosomal protein L31E
LSGSHSEIGSRLANRAALSSIEARHEMAMKIALDFLVRSGVSQDADKAVEFVGQHIARQIGSGEARVLMLANAAIDSYKRSLDQPASHPAI